MFYFHSRFWSDDEEENISCCLKYNNVRQARSQPLNVKMFVKPAASH
jgi:hypothetical protein